MQSKQQMFLFSLLFFCATAYSSQPAPGEEGPYRAAKYGITIPSPAADRTRGSGPFDTLIIKNVMVTNGEGAPPQGPLSIVVKNDRIKSIGAFPEDVENAEVIDGTGMYALPGFIDAHTHIGNPGQGLAGPITPPEYVFKLWLAHGITTVREVGSLMGLKWTVNQQRRSEAGEIAAPRIIPYAMFPGDDVTTAKGAESWVRKVHKYGAQGVKIRAATAAAIRAIYDTAKDLDMGTANHHDQTSVYSMNVLDSARLGLSSMEHWYGLPESLFTDRRIQHYPADYNYSDEQWRFSEAGRLWLQAAKPGSEKWNSVIEELVELDFTMVPTFTIYEANRDVARARDAHWHKDYTLPALQKFFMPNPVLHGSFHFDWTTADEIAWRDNFVLWQQFVNDFKNSGGRVATGSDAGFIFKLFGFSYVRELELLQEAGFHPLEVLQSATLNGAELLHMEQDIGSLTPGKKADIVLLDENPIANFKVLYGTGHMKLNRETNTVEQVGGVRYTIKDGIVFNAKELLADVADMVREAKNPVVAD